MEILEIIEDFLRAIKKFTYPNSSGDIPQQPKQRFAFWQYLTILTLTFADDIAVITVRNVNIWTRQVNKINKK